jgi:hypothetical protein
MLASAFTCCPTVPSRAPRSKTSSEQLAGDRARPVALLLDPHTPPHRAPKRAVAEEVFARTTSDGYDDTNTDMAATIGPPRRRLRGARKNRGARRSLWSRLPRHDNT